LLADKSHSHIDLK